MKWAHREADHQAFVIDINLKLLWYDKKQFMVRIAGTEKDPQLYIYSLGNTQECKHSGRLGDREERREKGAN